MTRRIPIARLALAAMLTAVLVALTACGGRAKAGPGGGVTGETAWPTGRTFTATAITERGQDRPLAAGTQITFRFPRDGELSVQAGCNYLGAKGELSAGRLTVSNLGTTLMACSEDRMKQDSWVTDLLSGKPAWHLEGTELIITGADGEIRLSERVEST
jgi:heat shock protein HslJ